MPKMEKVSEIGKNSIALFKCLCYDYHDIFCGGILQKKNITLF